MKTKRLTLLLELHEGSGQPLTSEADILRYCNVSPQRLAEACKTVLPFAMIRLEFYVLGRRAARARTLGRIPDGSVMGRTPTLEREQGKD